VTDAAKKLNCEESIGPFSA